MDNAELKKIAKLDFEIDNAISSLDQIDKKLKTIAETSEKYAKTIGAGINSGINTKNVEQNIATVKKSYDSMSKYEKNRVAEVEAYRQKQAIKTAAVIERENLKQANSVGTMYNKISQYAKTYLIYQGFNALKNGISDVIDEMVNLENRMVQIDRVLNESNLDLEGYRDKLLNLAYEYGNSIDNVTDIALRLAQAGFSSNETLKLTEKTLLAVNTAELNAKQATDDMVAVMAQWGYMTGDATEEAKKYGEIIDKINKVADNYPTTSADLMDALKKTSSAFNIAGASIDETIALITAAEVASQRGGKAIGTALSNIVQQLKDEKRLNIAESLGLDFYTDETKTNFKSVTEIFAEMSTKMQELKDSGKESSTEMQQLLSIFTVFRRNVGASLLGEMGGKDNTYLKVLNDSLTATGYSLQENEKYMKTTAAAQEQFNATLLNLKTEVWDAGVEDTYKSMLILGADLINNVNQIVKSFGAIPTIVGAVTLAFSLLSKKMNIVGVDAKTNSIQFQGLGLKLKSLEKSIKTAGMPKALRETADISKISFGTAIKNISSYETSLIAAKAKTILLKTATAALNVTFSAAATAGVMVLVSALQAYINQATKAQQLHEASIQSTEDRIKKYDDEASVIENSIKTYDELIKKENRTPEETTQLLEIQLKIKDLLGEHANEIDLINGKYEEQKKLLQGVYEENQKNTLEEKKKYMEQKKNEGVKYELPSFIDKNFGKQDYEKVLKKYTGSSQLNGYYNLENTMKNFSNIEEAISVFSDWEESLRGVQGESVEVANTYDWVNETLNKLKNSTEETDEATRDYYEALASKNIEEMFPEGSIKNAEDYKTALEGLKTLAEGSEGDIKIYYEALVELFQGKFPEFTSNVQNLKEELTDLKMQAVNETAATELGKLADQYSILTTAQEELSASGQLTAATFKDITENNLLDYLDVVNGKVVVNAKNLSVLAEEKKIEAIESLQAAAAEDIHKLALGQEADMSLTAKNAIASFGDNAATAGDKAQTAAGKILNMASALAQSIAASAQTAEDNGVENFKAKANAIASSYQAAAKRISAITIKPAGTTKRSGSSKKGRGSSRGSSRSSSSNSAEKAAEEAYKKRSSAFEDSLDKMTKEEEDWVKKQKQLGMLSNEDMLYVTKQRISRYNSYLDTIKKATWLNTEDRKKLLKEYTDKIKDLELDYFDYLKDKLEDETKAIEDARDKRIDALKEENEKRKQAIEDEADARIAALKKVEDTRDRKRDKEDYKKERQEILDEISYWSQRTGREAVESLADAKKRLKELDDDWNEKVEDWNTDDLIESIENQRDAQIKSIEEQEEREIKHGSNNGI